VVQEESDFSKLLEKGLSNENQEVINIVNPTNENKSLLISSKAYIKKISLGCF
jgi:hypothetical protein